MTNNQEGCSETKCKIVCSVQKIKSNASYIHYLRKNPLMIFSNTYDLIKMFISFKRIYIFPENSKTEIFI